MKRLNKWMSVSALTTAVCGFVAVAGMGGVTASAKTTPMLNLYNDKAGWANSVTAVGKYMAQKYGIGIKSVPYADTTTYQAAIDQSIMGSNPPDLLTWWTGDQLQKLVATGKLADLTQEWKIYEKEGVSPSLASAFTVNGKIYGAPLNFNYWVVSYNKHVFQKYGLKPPQTWAQLMSLCATLKSHGVTPFGQTVQGQWPGFIWFQELLVRSNPSLYKKLVAGKASYTDPGVVKVMKLWKSMEDKGYFSKPEDMGTGIPGDFAKGKIAMYLSGDWYNVTLMQAGLKPRIDYDEFIMPDVNPSAGKVVIFETSPIAVPKNGKNEQDALKALRDFYKPDVQKLWDTSQGYSPVERTVKLQSDPNQTIEKAMKSTHYTLIQRYWEATPPDVGQFAVQQFDKFELHPDTYMQDLQTIQTFAANYWKSQK